ncbi:MAG: hypothetical protein ACRERV_04250, partial [Methylococcales bacterium]
MGEHDEIRAVLHWLKRSFVQRIRWLTRIPILLFLLFVILHIIYPPAIEWVNETLHFPKPSLPAVLGLAVLVVILERVFVLEEMLEEVMRGRSLRVYAEQQQMYRDIQALVERTGARQAVLLQYSCHTCLPLVRTLRAKGAEVTVYMQDPNTAFSCGSGSQQRRVQGRYQDIPNELAELYAPDKLHIFQY